MKLKHLFLLIGFAAAVSLWAQERQFPQPAPMIPEHTQVWEPQPLRVTPGRACATVGSAPSDAIVLFDGTNLNAWTNRDGTPASWLVRDGVVFVNRETGDIITRQLFTDFQLHIEWMIPVDVQGEGQGRGNSGIFLQDLYEIQILDSYGCVTYIHGQAGGLYKQTPPLVNATRPPGEWNVYNIIWHAPTFRPDGSFRTPPRITAFHNGVLIHYNQILHGTTEWIGLPRVVEHGPMPIRLQAHGGSRQPVAFRNIWIRELK